MAPICADCNKHMRPQKNGVFFEELTEEGHPYKLWVGDRWECPECEHRVIVGVASQPVAEHYQPNYNDELVRRLPEHRIR